MFTLIIIFLVEFILRLYKDMTIFKYCDQKKQYLFFKMFAPIQYSENNASNSITYFIFSLILLSLIFYWFIFQKEFLSQIQFQVLSLNQIDFLKNKLVYLRIFIKKFWRGVMMGKDISIKDYSLTFFFFINILEWTQEAPFSLGIILDFLSLG